MINFNTLYQSGQVIRWHTHPTIKQQDVAAHSWGVAMICAAIDRNNGPLLRAALTHDCHEIELGDIPYQAKRGIPGLAEVSTEQERQFSFDHGILENLSNEDRHCLKWADMFELLLWAEREYMLGNMNMLRVMNTAKDALLLLDFPNDEARRIYNGRKSTRV